MSWKRGRQDDSNYSLCFINDENGAKYKINFGQEVREISLIKPEELLNIEYFLGKKFKITDGHILLSLVAKDRKNSLVEIKDKIDYLSMRYIFHSCPDGDEFVDFENLIFHLQVEAKGIERWELYTTDSYIFYSDLSTYQGAYALVRKIEEAIRDMVPNVHFVNNLGLCSECEKIISPNEHLYHQNFLCRECYEIEILKEKSKENVLNQRLSIKISKSKILPESEFKVSKKLREIIYQEYEGKCQYCSEPDKLPQEKIVIEHIIPRSIPLDSVSQLLMTKGVSEHHAKDFCKSMLPPTHDCLLNYTLACVRHNSKKVNRILHPAVIELLLNQSRIKSKIIIDRVNNS